MFFLMLFLKILDFINFGLLMLTIFFKGFFQSQVLFCHHKGYWSTKNIWKCVFLVVAQKWISQYFLGADLDLRSFRAVIKELFKILKSIRKWRKLCFLFDLCDAEGVDGDNNIYKHWHVKNSNAYKKTPENLIESYVKIS